MKIATHSTCSAAPHTPDGVRCAVHRCLSMGALLATVTLAWTTGACEVFESAPTELECEDSLRLDSGAVVVRVSAISPEGGGPLPPGGRIDSDVVISGTALHNAGLAIEQLQVAGVPAQNDGFNFDLWSVSVPYNNLAALPREDDGSVVPIEIVTRDVCGTERTSLVFDTQIDPEPTVRVEQLALQLTYPSSSGTVPAAGGLPVLVRVVGNEEAAGALVTLQASSGQFEGTVEGEIGGLTVDQTLLATSDTGAASATVYYFADGTRDGGTVQLTASAQDQVATALVDVVGAPTLIPSQQTIPAGLRTSIFVQSAGLPLLCQAQPVAGVSVTLDGVDLAARPVGVTGEAAPSIAVDADLAADQTFTVTCQDAFGQFATGTYTATATSP